MDNLQDFIDESFFGDDYESENLPDESNQDANEVDDEVVTTFLKLKLETAETAVNNLTRALLDKKKFQNELFYKSQSENKIVSEIDLELKDPIKIESHWLRTCDTRVILGMSIYNESITSLNNLNIILTTVQEYNVRSLKYNNQDSIFLPVNKIEPKSLFYLFAILERPSFERVPSHDLNGIILFDMDGRTLQFPTPKFVLNVHDIYKSKHKINFSSMIESNKEDIASFISAANKLTLLFDFFNDDASNIQDVERILRTFDFEPAYRQYYSNLRVLIHLIQVPDSNNLYLFKFYYTAETDLMILIQCMYSTLPQKFTISEVEEDQ